MGRAWPLTGRTEELRVITDIAGTAAAGIVLAGAAGVGKTRLAREALARAAGHGRVCRFVMATASAQSVPLGAFADYADRLGPDPMARVRDVVAAVTSSPSAAPVVVAVDDAHLLDEQSALVVHQIVRRHLATVVLTVRTGEPAPDAITALWKDELLPRLEVQPLSKAETAALLQTVLAGEVASSTAQGIWNYTLGNALYLRQLLADEIRAQRFTQRAGMWVWDTDLQVSPTLAELVDATVGRQSDQVIGVLDVLAIADPLEIEVLADIAGAAAIDEAEAQGLVTLDTRADPPLARLTHPMFGEVRRTRAGTLGLRSLRGRVARKLRSSSAPHLRVRRGLLLLDSDLSPDPTELIDAADGASQLFDASLAERFAAAAVKAGGGRGAEIEHARTLMECGRSAAAAAAYRALGDTAGSTFERVVLRLAEAASILLGSKNSAAAAQILRTVREPAAECGLAGACDGITAMLHALQGRSSEAVATALQAQSNTSSFPPQWGTASEFALVVGLGDMGRLDELPAAAERGYAITRSTFGVSTAWFMFGLWHMQGLRFGGLMEPARKVADRLASEAADVPGLHPSTAMTRGIAELAHGDLSAARRLFTEALAAREGSVTAEIDTVRTIAGAGLATVHAMTGERIATNRTLDEDAVTLLSAEEPMWDTDLLLARAWIHASSGMLSDAVDLLRKGAAREEERGRPAREVMCLQTAAQFGDRTAAARLTELASIVEGPRVVAAAAHAGALKAGDTEGLERAARMYKAFGDRIAAADAAAQAAVFFRAHGRRGAALTATALARRLAAETGADTPALRANAIPIPLTERQREIIALAAIGLSNREIADRLTMSVRTVEGHLFRASQKTGVNSREGLSALLEGS